MPIYDVKTSLINEGTADIERMMIKVTRLKGIPGEEFIKTFPLVEDRRNYRIIKEISEEVYPQKKRSFLGIGFNSYEYINYIKFYSTYKSFPLQKGDQITLYFEDGEEIHFSLEYTNKNEGYCMTNICPISDSDLEFLSLNRVEYWEISNAKQQQLLGGFCYQDNNRQYLTTKSGQDLFRKMAEEILSAKKSYFNALH